MKLKRSRNYRRGRIEIIPMIDVMFFLLVTFMLASLSMQSLNSIPVDLPQGDAPNLQHQEPVTMTVTKDSQIFLDKTPVTLDDMAFKLKAMLTTADKGVVVNADSAAPEGIVVEAMLQARRAGRRAFLDRGETRMNDRARASIGVLHIEEPGGAWSGDADGDRWCGSRC